MKKYKLLSKMWFLVLTLVALIAGCGGGGDGTADVSLLSIEVTPSSPGIAKNTAIQFAATGIYSNNTTKDLTSSVTWSSSDAAMATISDSGLATGTGAGLPTITALSAGVSGTTTLTITNATLVSITVTPTNPVMAKGTVAQFTATGIFSDNTKQDLSTQVAWSSSLGSAATISIAPGSKGLTTAVAAGSSAISAAFGAVTGTTILTVTNSTLASIAITPATPVTAPGKTSQFTATGIFTDNSKQDLSDQVTWSSSLVTVATISNAAGSKGLATSLVAGSSTITAAVGAVSGTNVLTVTDATLTSIAVTATSTSIAKGKTLQFTATGTFSDNSIQDITSRVVWSSSRGTVATISNATGSTGLATTVAAGSTTITATVGAVSGTKTLTVTNATLSSIAITTNTPNIAKGSTSQFAAIGTYSDDSTQDLLSSVTWSSSDKNVATISNAAGTIGLATSVAAGSTTITASIGAVSGATTLKVTSAVLAAINITPLNLVVVPRTSQQFTALGDFSGSTQNITASVTWSSSDTNVATVSNAAGSNGLVTTSGAKGTTTITAFDPVTQKTKNTTLTVALLPVNLGTAGNFVILAKTAVSTTGTTAVTGDIGLSPAAASYITGFGLIADSTTTFSTSSLVTGKVYAANYASPTPTILTTAVGDMQTAFTDAAGRSLPDYNELGAGNISGMTLVPGLYKWGTGVLLTSAGVTISGGANDVWIFQIAGNFTVNNSAIITLSGGAQAKNIFWQVSGQSTLGTAADFKGILLSQTLISMNTGAVMHGRALAQTAVTLNSNAVTAP